MTDLILAGARILTDDGFLDDHALLLSGGRIERVVPISEAPADAPVRSLPEGDLVPGFIDVQVNGGGGVLFNDEPTKEGIAAIGAAHRRFGTTGFLPTLISDDLAKVERAIAAVEDAIASGIPGVLGIHIEGPFLNPAKKGIHDDAKFRRIEPDMLDMLSALRGGRTLVTLAPERAAAGMVERLTERGILVCAGHTAANYEEIQPALAEGLRGFTHLFNAMTPFESRAPGVVGAALEHGDSWCGLIADGFHVHPASLRVALRAKRQDRFMLVTDAMPTVGSDRKSFMLGDKFIRAEGGRCADSDGTLAGSDLDMAAAVRNMRDLVGADYRDALRMASEYPASFLNMEDERGAIRPGLAADLVHLDEAGHVQGSWIAGVEETAA